MSSSFNPLLLDNPTRGTTTLLASCVPPSTSDQINPGSTPGDDTGTPGFNFSRFLKQWAADTNANMQQIANFIAVTTGGFAYQGVWNASTNTPALASGQGVINYVYKVSVAGSTTLDGTSVWNVGDFAFFDGTTWDKLSGGAFTTINNLPAGTALAGTENVAIYQGGQTVQVPASYFGPGQVDIQEFDVAGTYTWTRKPGNAVGYRLTLQSAGGGGASGPWLASLAAASGGAAGGGGGRVIYEISRGGLNATETLVVGSGGAPAAAPTGAGAGNAGSAGGNSYIGSVIRYMEIYGGAGGGAGQSGSASTGGNGGGPLGSGIWTYNSAGTTGQASSGPGGSAGGGCTGTGAAGSNGGFAAIAPSGGGAGGGLSGSAAFAGGVAWIPMATGGSNNIAGGALGGNPGQNGPGPAGDGPGCGGSGGGSNTSGAGGYGGNASRGGGGGGGGAGVGAAGGAGGKGGDGYIRIETFFGIPAPNGMPVGAWMLGLKTNVWNFTPALTDISYTNTGTTKLYSGQQNYSGVPNSTHYTTSNGYLAMQLGTDGVTGNLCTAMPNAQAGTLPYLTAANGFYSEVTVKLTPVLPQTGYVSDNFMAIWLMPQEHNSALGDTLTSPPAPLGVANYEGWVEIDTMESGFGSYEQALNTLYDHHGIYGSGYTNNEYTNTNLTPAIDFTQPHRFGAAYDPINKIVSYWVDDVQVANYSTSAFDYEINPYHFYQIMSCKSISANTQYLMEIRNLSAWTP